MANDEKKLLWSEPPKVINIGLEIFYESLLAQGAEAVQVDWKPPAGGDERIAKLLDKLLYSQPKENRDGYFTGYPPRSPPLCQAFPI